MFQLQLDKVLIKHVLCSLFCFSVCLSFCLSASPSLYHQPPNHPSPFLPSQPHSPPQSGEQENTKEYSWTEGTKPVIRDHEVWKSESSPEGHVEDAREGRRTRSIPGLAVQYLQATGGALAVPLGRKADWSLSVPSRGLGSCTEQGKWDGSQAPPQGFSSNITHPV